MSHLVKLLVVPNTQHEQLGHNLGVDARLGLLNVDEGYLLDGTSGLELCGLLEVVVHCSVSASLAHEAMLENASLGFKLVDQLVNDDGLQEFLEAVHDGDEALVTGIAAVVAGFVLEYGRKPATFEFVNGFDGVYFVLADQRKEFGICLEALLEEVLADLVETGRLRSLGLGERPLHVLGLDIDVDSSGELLVQVNLCDFVEFRGERRQLFA